MKTPPEPPTVPPRADRFRAATAAGRSLSNWLQGRAGWTWRVALGLLILGGPVWLWCDPLDGYTPGREGLSGFFERFWQLSLPFGGAKLVSDDFHYLAGARTLGDLRARLWVPHNSHVVPLFRAWTWVWARVAGNLAHTAETLAWASVLTWLAAMVLVGRLVERETGRPAAGLACAAVFGVSAVLEPTVRWYSAGQAIAAGVCILAMLVCLQGWRLRGGAWRLGLAAGWTVAAPLVWTAGLIAGPVGFVFLWADGRPHARRAAFVPVGATAAVAVLVFSLAGNEVTAAKNFHGRGLTEAADPIQGIISTAQATVEILVLRNFGLATETTPAQAGALLILLGGIWGWSRGRPWRLNPLEAAGGAIVLLGGMMVYTARGYYPFEQLRDIHWYQAIPQMGAFLFAVGWWTGRYAGAPAGRGPTTRGEMVMVVGIVAISLIVQMPRTHANLVGSVPALTPTERIQFPIPPLQRVRARYLRGEQTAWQRRYFARLDAAESIARQAGWGRVALRAALGGPAGPRVSIGMPKAPGFDPVDLLDLPEGGLAADPGPIRAALLPLLTPARESPPPWLKVNERWPPGANDQP